MSTPYRMISERLGVLGTGVALPGRPVSNEDMIDFVSLGTRGHRAEFVKAIADRLGVYQRYLVRDLTAPRELPRPGDTNPELCARAVRGALDQAGLAVSDIDLLIGHTTSPHTLLPPNVSWVADQLGYTGQYMELRQACTGFANALMIAGSMLATRAADCVCIVGSETGSVLFDIEEAVSDRNQLVNAAQMGDGAAAVLLCRDPGDATPFIDNVYFGTLGLGKPSGFSLATGGSSRPANLAAGSTGFHNDYNLAREEGLDLFVRGFEALRSVGLDEPQVTRYLTHQANGRMAEVLSPVLGIPEKKFHNCAAHHGNTGSASTWIGLHLVREQRVLEPGQVLGVLGAEATKFMYGGFSYTEGTQVGSDRRAASESGAQEVSCV